MTPQQVDLEQARLKLKRLRSRQERLEKQRQSDTSSVSLEALEEVLYEINMQELEVERHKYYCGQ